MLRALLLCLVVVLCGTSAEFRPLILDANGKTKQFPNGTDTLRVVPSYGLAANVPAASADNTGQIYIATDTLQILRSNGTTWDAVTLPSGTAGGDLSGTYPNPSVTGAADDAFSIYDDGDPSKLFAWTLGNQTTGTIVTVNSGAQSASRQVSLPVMTGDRTLAVIDQAQTFTGNQAIVGETASTNFQVNGSTGTYPWEIQASGEADEFYIQSNTAGTARLTINSAGETLLGTTTDSGAYRLQVNGATYQNGTAYTGGGADSSVSNPAILVENNRILTYLDSTSGFTNSGFIWYDSSNDLNLGARNSTKLTISNSLTTSTNAIVAPAATTSIPSIRLPHGAAPSAPTNGDVWTTTSGIYVRINGSTVGPLSTGGGGSSPTFKFSGRNSMVGIGASSTSEVSFLPTTFTGSATFGANTLTEGSIVRVRAYGSLNTVSTPTVNIKLKFGSSVLAGTLTLTAPTVAVGAFSMECDCIVRSTGGSGSMWSRGVFTVRLSGTSVWHQGFFSNAGSGSTTIDTTASNVLDSTVQFGTSDPDNQLTIETFTVEHILP